MVTGPLEPRWDVLYYLAPNRPAHLLWQPLLALSLYENSVLRCGRGIKLNPADEWTSCSTLWTGSYGRQTT